MRGAGALIAAALIAPGAAAADPPIEDRLRRLEERIAQQEAEIARLKRAAAPAAPPELPAPIAAVRVSGYVQADAVIHRQSSQDELSPAGEPLNQDRFSIPRAHLRVEASRWLLLGALEVAASTANGPVVRPVEASLTFRVQGPDRGGVPILDATTGLMKIPFGAEVPEIDPRRFFLERSAAARALFPGTFDLGFRLQGGYRFLRYAVAFMNGEPTGEPTFPARDPNKGKDLIGRVGVDATPAAWLRVRAGLSGLGGVGLHRGTPATKDALTWRDANEDGLVQNTEIQVIAGAPATPSMDYHRFALGFDLAVSARLPVLGELTVMGELVRAQNLDRALEPADPVSAGRDLRELGYHVGATLELTRYAMIGVRRDHYDPDFDAGEQRGVTRVPRDRAYDTTAIAVAGRYPPGRLIVEYDRNRNALGRTAGGVPTSLADDAFTVRAEVVF